MASGTRTAARDDEVVAAVDEVVDAWLEVQTLLMTRMPNAVADRFGIPTHRLHVLGAVERGATRIQEIAEGSWTSVSAASRTVDGLVREGWLDRRPDPEDRRATQVTLTEQGRAHVDEVRAWATAMVGELVTDLGVGRARRLATDLAALADGVTRWLDQADD